MAALRSLLASRPLLHGGDHDPVNWQLGDAVLERVADLVDPRWHTLETGCGYSTVVLAASGAHHTVLSPTGDEHRRIQAWCGKEGISVERVQFIEGASQRVLPTLDVDDLDLVLIDGDHAFPTPFIDWYYTAERLRVGGILVVDDIQIRTVRVLRDFLRAEAGRWRAVGEIGTTALFEKITAQVTDPWSWRQQPFAAAPHPTAGPLRWARRLAARVARRSR
jgi:hypothetical protein